MLELFQLDKFDGVMTKIEKFRPQFLLNHKELRKIKERLEGKYGFKVYPKYREIPDDEFEAYVVQNNMVIPKRFKKYFPEYFENDNE